MFESKTQGPRSSSEMSRRLPGWGLAAPGYLLPCVQVERDIPLPRQPQDKPLRAQLLRHRGGKITITQ